MWVATTGQLWTVKVIQEDEISSDCYTTSRPAKSSRVWFVSELRANITTIIYKHHKSLKIYLVITNHGDQKINVQPIHISPTQSFRPFFEVRFPLQFLYFLTGNHLVSGREIPRVFPRALGIQYRLHRFRRGPSSSTSKGWDFPRATIAEISPKVQQQLRTVIGGSSQD